MYSPLGTGGTDSIFAYFDFAAFPSGEEIFSFMLAAESMRRTVGVGSIKVQFVPGPAPRMTGDLPEFCGGRGPQPHRVVQSLSMMPTITGFAIHGSREEAVRACERSGKHVFPPEYHPERSLVEGQGRPNLERLIPEHGNEGADGGRPQFTLPRQAAKYIERWLGARLGDRRLLTITLSPPPDTDASAALRDDRLAFLEKIDAASYLPVLIADRWIASCSLPETCRNVAFFPGAGPFSPLRYGLYKKAQMNLIECSESLGLIRADPQIPAVFFGTADHDGAPETESAVTRVCGYDGGAILAAMEAMHVISPNGRATDRSNAKRPTIGELFPRALALQKNPATLPQAIRIYSAILRACPRHAGATGMLGAIAMILGDSERALGLLETAVMLDGSDPAHRYNLANLLTLLGRESEASAAYREALALDPNLKVAWQRLARLKAKFGETEEAEACYRNAGIGAAMSLDTLFEYAEWLAALGRDKEAAEGYRTAGMRYLDLLEDEDAACAMIGVFRCRPYMPRNGCFPPEWETEADADTTFGHIPQKCGG